MTRTIPSRRTPVHAFGLLGLLGIAAFSTFPTGCQSGGVGDPCIPEDEYNAQFSGFKMTEENIESRSFQCQTRICLVNHFQGRVSCPLGQTPIVPVGTDGRHTCNQGDNSTCNDGEECVEAASLAPECADNDDCAGFGNVCNKEGKFCECTAASVPPPGGFFCDAQDHHWKTYVCHKKDNCQRADVENPDDNKGKDCCVPGTDTPVVAEVCGQCDKDNSKRDAADSVYCSCRCCPEGETCDDGFNYCECPTGFTCSEIRKDVGLGDPLLTGSYCIKEGSEFVSESKTPCDKVKGYRGTSCAGIAAQ